MKESLRKIMNFAFNSNESKFIEVFNNEDLGKHLWAKYINQYNSNFLEFYNGGLDKENKKIVEDYIETL